jgi:hypothetical protein
MERVILTVLALCVLAEVSGCVGPGYGPTYGYPAYGYAPYSYGFPVYASGYQPDFIVHHPWEEHHAYGHPAHFFPNPETPHFASHPPGGGFAEHPAGGGSGGGPHGGRR